jgi:hypothetical protein
MPGPEALMKGRPYGPREKKNALAYKLQLDIEVATDLKKILEKCILNGMVEFTLGEVLGLQSVSFMRLSLTLSRERGKVWIRLQLQTYKV